MPGSRTPGGWTMRLPGDMTARPSSAAVGRGPPMLSWGAPTRHPRSEVSTVASWRAGPRAAAAASRRSCFCCAARCCCLWASCRCAGRGWLGQAHGSWQTVASHCHKSNTQFLLGGAMTRRDAAIWPLRPLVQLTDELLRNCKSQLKANVCIVRDRPKAMPPSGLGNALLACSRFSHSGMSGAPCLPSWQMASALSKSPKFSAALAARKKACRWSGLTAAVASRLEAAHIWGTQQTIANALMQPGIMPVWQLTSVPAKLEAEGAWRQASP